MSDLDKVLAHIDADLDDALERLFDMLRIKSISTDPAYAGETPRLRRMARGRPRRASASTRACATPPGHPMVVGARPHARRAPRCCSTATTTCSRSIRWNSGTTTRSSPSIETRADGIEGHPSARGASDDKGQLMTFVEACRAWKAVTGKLPIPVTILLEGEEESGGANLPPFLEANADELRADIGADLRHQHVGHGHAGDHHHAARPLRRGDRHPRRRPRPAFGLLRLGRGQPQPRARPHHRRPARRGRPHHPPRLLRRRARTARRRCATAGPSSTSPKRPSSARSACRSRPARRAARCWR